VLYAGSELPIRAGIALGASSALNVVAAYDMAKALPPNSTVVTILCDNVSAFPLARDGFNSFLSYIQSTGVALSIAIVQQKMARKQEHHARSARSLQILAGRVIVRQTQTAL